MIIADNMLANGAARQLKIIGTNKKKPTERLSSGYRINRASDDAAGLSISEKMRGQIRGLTRASQNIQDGISLLQTGEGALGEVHSMLQRIRELAVEASNDTFTDDDREAIDKEVQEIKEEMTRVFNDAEFNTIQIFRARYVPDVKTVPNDYELYNSADGTPAAGVMINHKRYSWEELGAPTTLQSSDWEKKFYDDNGELIWLRLKAGSEPSEMHRVYFLEADDQGIKINNLYAGKWDSTIEQNGNTYSFSFHGMDISFDTHPDDSREDIIKQLSPDGLSFNSWDAIPMQGGSFSAVNVAEDTMTFLVTNSNKNDIDEWSYRIEADDAGIALIQTNGDDGLNHTKTNWGDFKNTNSGEAFPISDWGVETEGSNPVTLSSLPTGTSYNYTDNANASYLMDGLTMDFSFPLNESSKQQVMDGITQDLVEHDVDCPISSITSSDNHVTIVGYSGIDSFILQRDKFLRDFGENGSDSDMILTVDRQISHATGNVTWAIKNSNNQVLSSVSRYSQYFDSAAKFPLGDNSFISLMGLRYVSDSTFDLIISPDGMATKSFTNPERSAGTATNTALTVLVNPTEKILHFQAGANAGQSIDMKLPGLSNSIIGIGSARFTSSELARASISMADMAIEKISEVRSHFGAYQNRLEHANSVDKNTAENLQNAESRIRDADMAKEAMELAKQSILEQVGQSMITQANQNTQGILKLLQ